MEYPKIEILTNLILGIIDIPKPQVFLLQNQEIIQVRGSKKTPLETKLCKEIEEISENFYTIFTIEELRVDSKNYRFFLSIILENGEVLVFLSISKKLLSRQQLISLEELQKLDLRSNKSSEKADKLDALLTSLRSIKKGSNPPNKQIQNHLALGLKILEMDIAILSKVKNKEYEIIHCEAKDNSLEAGSVFDLENTYCDITVKSDRTIAIENMRESPYYAHPCYQNFQLDSYIGTPYRTDWQFGTLSFSCREKRTEPFSSFELEYVKYIAVIIENLLAHHHNKQQLDFERNMTQSFIQSVPVAIAMFDTELRYLEASEKWIETYSINRDIIGISHYDIFPEISLEWREIHNRALSGEYIKKNEDRFVRSDGTVQYLNWKVTPWYDADSKIGGIIMYVEDITDTVLQKLKKIEDAEQKSVEAVQVKEEFAYIASHDLQEPVRSIMSVSNLLKSRYAPELDEHGQKLINYINENSSRMNLLIKGLLDYGRLGKKTALTLVPVTQVVEEVENDLHQLIKENNASIQTNSLPEVYGYETEIRMLFQNLIANAVKFRKQDQEPIVQIDYEEKQRHWLFSIKDNGIGISKQDQKKVFKLFKQLHSRKKYKGIGIGLAHCWRIVEMHSGKIWVESEKGKGSTFYFTLEKNLDFGKWSSN